MPISEKTNISLYGKGVFTTIAFCSGEPFLWDKHWNRLIDSSHTLGLDIAEHSEHSVRDAMSKAIVTSGIVDGRLRISFLDGSSSDLWSGDEKATLLSILVAERRPVANIFRLTTSPFLVNTASPLAGVKSCNYLEHLMSFQDAKKRGFDEAVRLNERGEVTSASIANLFWLKGSRLYTPSLKTGCLAGTTREFVIENLECEEVEVGIEVLQEADEIFLTSAGIGVVQAAKFDGRELRCSDHPIKRVLPF